MTLARTLLSCLALALLTLTSGCNPPPQQSAKQPTLSASPSSSQSEPISPGQAWEPPVLSESKVELSAVWGPMTGANIDSLRRSELYGQLVRDLKIETPKKDYHSSYFDSLLWSEPVTVGQIWSIEHRSAAKFLTQFRTEVKTNLNINGKGAHGILRAVSDDYYDVLFRLHAQFPINKLYLTPSQFDGRLLIDRNTGDIQHVLIEVPRNQVKNLAFEVHDGRWMTGLGVVEEMKLEGQTAEPPEVDWAEEITTEQARKLLADAFYECRKINWLPLEQAIGESKKQQKPLFVLAIAGALDDQSC